MRSSCSQKAKMPFLGKEALLSRQVRSDPVLPYFTEEDLPFAFSIGPSGNTEYL